jgi:peptide/nickel transport system permease protein
MGLNANYVLRRFGMFLLTIWIGATVIFFIPRLAPGDPFTTIVTRMEAQGIQVEGSDQMIQSWRARFGLDKPLHIQYLAYMRNMLTLNLGYSLTNFPTEVINLIQRSIPWTIGLLLTATLLSFFIGNLIGTLIAWRRSPKLLRTLLPFTLVFTSIPFYMLGILLIYLFSVILHWFPTYGAFQRGLQESWNLPFIRSLIYHGTLPASAIILASMGFWALGMRGMMITTAGEDYILLANAKGLMPGYVLWRYTVRNAILPQVTALSLSLGGIAGGSMLVEMLFSYPGMGYLLNTAIMGSDYTLIQGIVFIMILGISLGAFIIDLLYPILDPRITYEKR